MFESLLTTGIYTFGFIASYEQGSKCAGGIRGIFAGIYIYTWIVLDELSILNLVICFIQAKFLSYNMEEQDWNHDGLNFSISGK